MFRMKPNLVQASFYPRYLRNPRFINILFPHFPFLILNGYERYSAWSFFVWFVFFVVVWM